jgi:hypothetical protein
LHGQPVIRESNDYKLDLKGLPNTALREAQLIGDYIATQMAIPRADLDTTIGSFIMGLGVQPNNPRGHAFRSIVAELLSRYGDQQLLIEEEVDPHPLFPGFVFGLRSKKPRIDIVVYRARKIVALCSARWTYRHDRVDMLEEAVNYMAAARRVNQNCKFFGITAEVNPARLRKVLSQTAPVNPNPAMDRLVHLHVPLATTVIGHNGTLAELWDLVDWVKDSANWH